MWTRTTAHRLLAADDRNREIGAVNLTAAKSAKRSLRLFVDEADSGELAVDGGHQPIQDSASPETYFSGVSSEVLPKAQLRSQSQVIPHRCKMHLAQGALDHGGRLVCVSGLVRFRAVVYGPHYHALGVPRRGSGGKGLDRQTCLWWPVHQETRACEVGETFRDGELVMYVVGG